MIQCSMSSRILDPDSNFEEDKMRFEDLQAKLSKNAVFAENTLNLLRNFDTHVLKVDDSISPLYEDTENWQLSQKNVKNALACIENIVDCYKVTEEVEQDIRKGPSPVSEGGCGLDAYLSALGHLVAAGNYFTKYNPQSVELENVNTLMNVGSDNLNREFKGILFKFSKILAPADLLSLISPESEISVDLTDPVWHQIPMNALKDLVRISSCLMRNNRDEFMTIYGQIRATILQRSLQSLKDHQRSASIDSNQNLHSSYGGSPIMVSKFQSRHDTSRRLSTKRLQQAFEKRANRMFLKASQTLETSTNFLLGSSRRSSFLDISGSSDELYSEQEMDNYLEYVMSFYKLMKIEQNLMKDIVPNTHQHRVFEIIIRDTMDTIVQDGKHIVSRAKKCISRCDYVTVLVIFPILKQLRQLKPDFDRIIENCDINMRAKFTTIVDSLYTTSTKILDDFIDNLRTDSSSQLPQDGNVYETTSNVVIFLEQLLDHIDIVGEILAEFYPNSLEKLKPANKNKAHFGLYIKKVLGQLNITLINRSEQYNDTSLKAIFRLNNSHHILKCLIGNQQIFNLIKIVEPNCEQTYYKLIEEHKQLYLQGWSKLLSFIEVTEDYTVHGHKLKIKDRCSLKDKFAGFNKEVEEIAHTQRGYSIPDVQLRESLKRDNKELILPKYNAFYDNYSNLPFTKNSEKYIKYSPAQISAMIDRFFDAAA